MKHTFSMSCVHTAYEFVPMMLVARGRGRKQLATVTIALEPCVALFFPDEKASIEIEMNGEGQKKQRRYRSDEPEGYIFGGAICFFLSVFISVLEFYGLLTYGLWAEILVNLFGERSVDYFVYGTCIVVFLGSLTFFYQYFSRFKNG